MKKLSESVWGDIRKKSLGQEIRLEDDINQLSLDEFCEYLKTKYKCIYHTDDIGIVSKHEICVTLLKDQDGLAKFLFYDGETIHMFSDVLNILHCMNPAKQVFKLKYTTFKERNDGILFCPKDGSDISNRFFIKVLDFLLYQIDKTDEVYTQIMKTEE